MTDMKEEYERLQKFVNMIDATKSKEEALEVVAKIILAVEEDETLIDAATAYVNDCLIEASIDNTTYYA